MVTRNTPPAYGLSGGPIIVACQWNMSSATGPITNPPKIYSKHPSSYLTYRKTTIQHLHYQIELNRYTINTDKFRSFIHTRSKKPKLNNKSLRRTGAAGSGRILLQILKLLQDALGRHDDRNSTYYYFTKLPNNTRDLQSYNHTPTNPDQKS